MWTALETLFNKNTLKRVEINLKKLFFQRQTSQTLNEHKHFLMNFKFAFFFSPTFFCIFINKNLKEKINQIYFSFFVLIMFL